MDFIGTGRRLAQGDVGNAARLIDVPTAALLAVMEVEARGSGFDAQRRPIILYEPHRFYAELGAGAKRDQAVREGLAYARWGAQPYPAGSNAQYQRLARALAIDRDAALKSCSWGLPQILASNHRDAGFASPVAMVEVFKAGELEQLQSLCSLLKAWGLDEVMRQGDWTAFARRYNGPGYARHGYHTRLAAAFAKHSNKEDTMVANALLRVGSKGEAVRSLQSDLVALGFDPGPVDGRFGPKTEAAVRQAQARLGVPVDSVVGPATRAVLDAALAKANVAVDGGSDTWAEREEKPLLPPAVVIEPEEDAALPAPKPVTGGPTSKATGGAIGASFPQALLLLTYKLGLIPAEVAADPETIIYASIVIGALGGWIGAYLAPKNAAS